MRLTDQQRTRRVDALWVLANRYVKGDRTNLWDASGALGLTAQEFLRLENKVRAVLKEAGL